MKTILKVVVGSQAHGLADEKSDWDYRGVFVVPTSEMLKTFTKQKRNSWIEGDVDDTSYEIGHFLELCQKGNLSVLEILFAPMVEITPLGRELKQLYPKMTDTKSIVTAAIGYSHNQRKKMEDNKDGRKWKYAVAYCRSLIQAKELLTGGKMTFPFSKPRYLGELKSIRAGRQSMGWVLDFAEFLTEELRETEKGCPVTVTDKKIIDDFLLRVRQSYWSEDTFRKSLFETTKFKFQLPKQKEVPHFRMYDD